MERILGHPITFFQNELIQQALTHRSVTKKNNERLEFLGDSILNSTTAIWLYHHFPNISEGKLSRMRSNLVKGETLAEVARYYNLGDQLKLGVGELKSGGFNRASVLADAVEAVFGAVFIDKGFEPAQQFILKVMQAWFEKSDPSISDKDSKTRLQEYLQKKSMQIPIYTLVSEKGQDHRKTFEVQCEVVELKLSSKAERRSRKKAEQESAQLLLEKIGIP
jgi:ribonuclease-3